MKTESGPTCPEQGGRNGFTAHAVGNGAAGTAAGDFAAKSASVCSACASRRKTAPEVRSIASLTMTAPLNARCTPCTDRRT